MTRSCGTNKTEFARWIFIPRKYVGSKITMQFHPKDSDTIVLRGKMQFGVSRIVWVLEWNTYRTDISGIESEKDDVVHHPQFEYSSGTYVTPLVRNSSKKFYSRLYSVCNVITCFMIRINYLGRKQVNLLKYTYYIHTF